VAGTSNGDVIKINELRMESLREQASQRGLAGSAQADEYNANRY